MYYQPVDSIEMAGNYAGSLIINFSSSFCTEEGLGPI